MGSKKSEFLITALNAAQRAGEVIIQNLGTLSKEDVDYKEASDYVTRVDRESEQIIIDTIHEVFPEHHFLAEESLHDTGAGGYLWIIDPLDGTTNFIHGYPQFSVSIALQHDKEMITGVIFDPLRNESFTTDRGKGAFLNEKRVTVSKDSLQTSLITTGFPFRKKEFIDLYLRLFRNIFDRVSDIRRAGSAALDLAHLASGRCDGFFEIGLSPWDIAAGSLLIRESGGVITDFGGGEDFLSTGNIVAGSPDVHRELLKEVRNIFKGIIDR
jgi:myo-inositol-1(or 4)-monophosphatase